MWSNRQSLCVHIVILWIWLVLVDRGIYAASATEKALDRWYGRSKRAVTCEKRYQEITSDHSRCLSPSPRAESLGEVTAEDIRVILDIHNRVRREVSPPAAYMLQMTWDTSIAKTAAKWALHCETRHDRSYSRYEFGRFAVGQNLAWGSYDLGWEKAISLWANEKEDFVYGGKNSLHAVGHYTQMVWADTATIGCQKALCDGRTYLYVCNYGPAGNLNINEPYELGRSCEKCQDRCNDKLCDCGGKVCLNGGEMDFNTCTCRCKQQFQVEPVCGINCTDIERVQPWHCVNQFGPANCERYSNVPADCPYMCGWCPDADYEIIQITGDNPSSTEILSYSGRVTYLVLTLNVFVIMFS